MRQLLIRFKIQYSLRLSYGNIYALIRFVMNVGALFKKSG